MYIGYKSVKNAVGGVVVSSGIKHAHNKTIFPKIKWNHYYQRYWLSIDKKMPVCLIILTYGLFHHC